MEKYNPDNELFLDLCEANECAEPRRIKGYYICPANGGCGLEFLKAIDRPVAKCPLCGKEVNRVLHMDPVEVYMLEKRWREDGVYSDLRADRRSA